MISSYKKRGIAKYSFDIQTFSYLEISDCQNTSTKNINTHIFPIPKLFLQLNVIFRFQKL